MTGERDVLVRAVDVSHTFGERAVLAGPPARGGRLPAGEPPAVEDQDDRPAHRRNAPSANPKCNAPTNDA